MKESISQILVHLDGTTHAAQRLQAAKPDLILFGASNFSDAAQVLSKGIELKVKLAPHPCGTVAVDAAVSVSKQLKALGLG